jgi:hypothetical protein
MKSKILENIMEWFVNLFGLTLKHTKGYKENK